MSKLARDHRNRDLAMIHMAVATLQWSEADYRAALLARTSKDSAALLDADERRSFIDYLRRCGWHPGQRKYTQADKIQWLWTKLQRAGALRDPSPAAQLAMVGRTAGVQVEHLKSLTSREATKVMEALKAMLARTQPNPRT